MGEFVICAAIWYDDGKNRSNLPLNIDTGIVAAGWRHHNCYTILWTLFPKLDYLGTDVQGFLTSKGRFVDRKEGALIAFKAEQISSPKTELYSEDLY